MPVRLFDDFPVYAGSIPQLTIPGVAAGKFFDLATADKKHSLTFRIDPGTGPVNFTTVSEVAGETDETRLTLSFLFPSPIVQPQIVQFVKSAGGTPVIGGVATTRVSHSVLFNRVTAVGVWQLKVWNGYDEVLMNGYRTEN